MWRLAERKVPVKSGNIASIMRKVALQADAEAIWSAVKDVGAVATKLAPGVVTQSSFENGMRHVTFANGLMIEELIVSVDDSARRVVYAVQGRAKHHQASMQVISDGPGKCHFAWITDVLPDEAATRFADMMDQALPVIKRTLESNAHPTGWQPKESRENG